MRGTPWLEGLGNAEEDKQHNNQDYERSGARETHNKDHGHALVRQ